MLSGDEFYGDEVTSGLDPDDGWRPSKRSFAWLRPDERAALRLDRRINAYTETPTPQKRRLVVEAERLYRRLEGEA